jgi:hypothetical protein
MGLTTNLYFFGGDYERQPTRRTIMDALVARLPEVDQRQRIAAHGAIRVAFDDFDWLLNHRGAETLLDPPVQVFLVAMRRFGEAPVYLSPVDLVRRFHALGWIPAEQLADLPPEALEPPKEAEAVSLDRVMTRFFPPGSLAGMGDEEWRRRSAGLAEAIKAHLAEHDARHGALAGAEET